MFKTETIWDYRVMTKGTVIKLIGFSPMNDFIFKGLEYKVKKTHLTTLTIQGKSGKTYQIEPWEIGDDPDIELTIEIVMQIPWEMPFLRGKSEWRNTKIT